MKLKLTGIFSEVTSLLYWSMLAACTVGPGTVVTCARAGAEYGMSLIWALVFASIMAFILQEGTARLTIVSGQSLGHCFRAKYGDVGPLIYSTSIICWVISVSVYIGNTLYEANNWAGGIDAILTVPGAESLGGGSLIGVRVGSCVGYAVIVLALLYWDKTDKLGVVLGLVMIGMVVLFIYVVANVGINWKELGLGLLPNLPSKSSQGAEPTDIVLSLVGTTSIGFNLFLGGFMAQGKKITEVRRGIGFSVISALAVSSLILMVGAGMLAQEGEIDTGSSFSISQLAGFIKSFVGEVGVTIFAIGFIAAALSSMLTVPLGAVITADSLLSPGPIEPLDQSQQGGLSRVVKLSMMTIMVLIATVVIACNVDRLVVIMIAQVFNGCLLPFLSTCLLLCLNDRKVNLLNMFYKLLLDSQLMNSEPQSGLANIVLFISVIITFFLASNVVIQKVFSSLISTITTKLLISMGVALLGMFSICIFTSLGRELVLSLRRWRL